VSVDTPALSSDSRSEGPVVISVDNMWPASSSPFFGRTCYSKNNKGNLKDGMSYLFNDESIVAAYGRGK
jgi:hypothetical protein